MSRARMESFSLTADMMYVSQNAPRICRALFEICLRRSWSTAAELALTLCKVLRLSTFLHMSWFKLGIPTDCKGVCTSFY